MDLYESLEKGDWRNLEEFVRSKGYNTDFMPLEHMISNSSGFKEAYSEIFDINYDAEPRAHWIHKYDDIFTLVKRDNDYVYYTDCWNKNDEKEINFSTGRFPSVLDDHFRFDISQEENNIITLACVREMKLLNFNNWLLSSFLNWLDVYFTKSVLERFNSYCGKDAIDFIIKS